VIEKQGKVIDNKNAYGLRLVFLLASERPLSGSV
jgi:hypothetical protein